MTTEPGATARLRDRLHQAISDELFRMSGSDGDMCAQDWDEQNTDDVLAALAAPSESSDLLAAARDLVGEVLEVYETQRGTWEGVAKKARHVSAIIEEYGSRSAAASREADR